MKHIKRNILVFVEKMVRVEVNNNTSQKPPHCCGIFHQPMRPTKRDGLK
jgi:cyclic lactone autoinducer peptide